MRGQGVLEGVGCGVVGVGDARDGGRQRRERNEEVQRALADRGQQREGSVDLGREHVCRGICGVAQHAPTRDARGVEDAVQ